MSGVTVCCWIFSISTCEGGGCLCGVGFVVGGLGGGIIQLSEKFIEG